MKHDFRPEKLSSFLLGNTPLLRGFVQAKPEARVAPLFDKPDGTIATLNIRLFQGPSELSYSVLQFTNKEALTQWDQAVRKSAPGWVSPLLASVIKGAQVSKQGGAVTPGLEAARAAVVGNYVIVVHVFQHAELLRRTPALKKIQVPSQALNQLQASVLATLIRRAQAGTTAI